MKWDALVMGMLAPVGAEMIRALAPRDGSEHLDVAWAPESRVSRLRPWFPAAASC
jgi:hypothetical protein